MTTTQDAPAGAPSDPPATRSRPGLNTDTLALGGLFVAMFAFLAAVLAVAIATRAADEHRMLAASGTTATPAAATTIALSEFSLDPQDLSVPEGTTSVQVRNDGAIVHNLSIDSVASPMLDAGETTELDVSSLPPGTYSMRCDVAGHEAAGMKGSFTIG